MAKTNRSTLESNPKRELVDLRLRAEKDQALSYAAFWMLSAVISDRYIDSNFSPADEFPLAWSFFRQRMCRSTAEKYLNELVERKYLFLVGIKGSPPTNHYQFVLRCVTSYASKCVKVATSGCFKSYASRCVADHAYLISNPFGKEILREGSGAASAAVPASPLPSGVEDEIPPWKRDLRKLQDSLRRGLAPIE
jgi:hypothetical protein